MLKRETKEFYREFFNKYYRKDMVVIPEKWHPTKEKVETRKKAIVEFNKWYEPFLTMVENMVIQKRNQDIDKTIGNANPFDMNAVKNENTEPLRFDTTRATLLVMNKYFDCLVKVQLPQYADGHRIRAIRKKTSTDFYKGKYLNYNTAALLYEAIRKLTK